MTNNLARRRGGTAVMTRQPQFVSCSRTHDATIRPPDQMDAPLITAVRRGNIEAYGQLYKLHVAAACNLAQQLTRSPAEADDLVSEAFAKVLAALRGGRGPDTAFRAYLLTALRHVAYDKTRRDRKLQLAEDVAALASPATVSVPFQDTAVAAFEHDLVARAFVELPDCWQAALWYTEVKDLSPAQAALRLDLTPNGMSALAYRARGGLTSAYVQAHLADVDVTGTCRPTFPLLAAWARNALSKRDEKRVGRHLQDCPHCQVRVRELHEVNPRRRCESRTALQRRDGSACPCTQRRQRCRCVHRLPERCSA